MSFNGAVDSGQVKAMAGIATARRLERPGWPRARKYPSSRGASDISDSGEAQDAGSTPIRSIDRLISRDIRRKARFARAWHYRCSIDAHRSRPSAEAVATDRSITVVTV
jgi:hypothetical protein